MKKKDDVRLFTRSHSTFSTFFRSHPLPRIRTFQPLAQSRSPLRTMAASTLRAPGARAVQRCNVSAAAGSSSVAAPAPISRLTRSAAATVAATAAPATSIASVNGMRRPASSSRASVAARAAIRDGATLDGRKLRVAVIGGGPSGACAAETLAKGGVETFLIERKMDNCKVR
jgi:hypothetical protein